MSKSVNSNIGLVNEEVGIVDDARRHPFDEGDLRLIIQQNEDLIKVQNPTRAVAHCHLKRALGRDTRLLVHGLTIGSESSVDLLRETACHQYRHSSGDGLEAHPPMLYYVTLDIDRIIAIITDLGIPEALKPIVPMIHPNITPSRIQS